MGPMSSIANSMPSASAQLRPSVRLSGSDSRSGSSSPNTRPAPTARTARAAQTELSTPPLIATTRPRRNSWVLSWSRNRSQIAAVV